MLLIVIFLYVNWYLTSQHNFLTSRHNNLTSWHNYQIVSLETTMSTSQMLCRLVRCYVNLSDTVVDLSDKDIYLKCLNFNYLVFKNSINWPLRYFEIKQFLQKTKFTKKFYKIEFFQIVLLKWSIFLFSQSILSFDVLCMLESATWVVSGWWVFGMGKGNVICWLYIVWCNIETFTEKEEDKTLEIQLTSKILFIHVADSLVLDVNSYRYM